MGYLAPLLFWLVIYVFPSNASEVSREENEQLLRSAWTHHLIESQIDSQYATLQEQPRLTFPLSQQTQNRILASHIAYSLASCFGAVPLMIGVDTTDWRLITLGVAMVTAGNILRMTADGIAYTRVSTHHPSCSQYLVNGLFQRAYIPSYLLQGCFAFFTYATMKLLVGPTSQLTQLSIVLPVIAAGVLTIALVGSDFYVMRRFASGLRSVHRLL